MPLAVENGMVIVLAGLVSIPLFLYVLRTYVTNAWDEVGKGPMAMDGLPRDEENRPYTPPVSKEQREDEIRQMLQARSHRHEARGEAPIDVEAELSKILATENAHPGGSLADDQGLRTEIRQLVIASNERRARAGKDPLDVEEEIEKKLKDFEGLQ